MELQLVHLGSVKLRHLWHRSAVLWGVTPSGLVTDAPSSRRHIRSLSLGRVKLDTVSSPAQIHISVTAAKASGLACCEGPDLSCFSRLV